jgi:hypothetical protein
MLCLAPPYDSAGTSTSVYLEATGEDGLKAGYLLLGRGPEGVA